VTSEIFPGEEKEFIARSLAQWLLSGKGSLTLCEGYLARIAIMKRRFGRMNRRSLIC
jgi:hypothetical protein